jgi:hypothetical protein
VAQKVGNEEDGLKKIGIERFCVMQRGGSMPIDLLFAPCGCLLSWF